MRSITYLDSKNNQVRKQWSEAISGVVVLWLAEDNIYIERTADVYKFLCDVRYNHVSKGFIQKYPVNFKKKPDIFLARFDGNNVDLTLLFRSVLNYYQNTFVESHIRTTDYHGEDLTQTDINNLSLNSNYPEDFLSIWKSDKENQADIKFNKEQELLQLEEARKKAKEQAKQVAQKEAELSKKFEKEMATFKKGIGMKLPKKKYNKQSEDKLLWKM